MTPEQEDILTAMTYAMSPDIAGSIRAALTEIARLRKALKRRKR